MVRPTIEEGELSAGGIIIEAPVSQSNPRRSRKLLLRQAKARRTTLPGTNAATGNDEAETPWDITTAAQVQHWAAHDPSEFLNLLNELRSERDLAMECVELGKEQEDQLKDQLLAQGNKVIAQAEEISSLKEDVSAAVRVNDALQSENRVTPASSNSPSTAGEGKRSPRHPDPPVFTDGEDPTFDDWSLRIHDKLSVNADHFASEASKAIYVISRTGGNAADHLTVYRINGKADYFKTPTSVLQVLEDIYSDPDRQP